MGKKDFNEKEIIKNSQEVIAALEKEPEVDVEAQRTQQRELLKKNIEDLIGSLDHVERLELSFGFDLSETKKKLLKEMEIFDKQAEEYADIGRKSILKEENAFVNSKEDNLGKDQVESAATLLNQEVVNKKNEAEGGVLSSADKFQVGIPVEKEPERAEAADIYKGEQQEVGSGDVQAKQGASVLEKEFGIKLEDVTGTSEAEQLLKDKNPEGVEDYSFERAAVVNESLAADENLAAQVKDDLVRDENRRGPLEADVADAIARKAADSEKNLQQRNFEHADDVAENASLEKQERGEELAELITDPEFISVLSQLQTELTTREKAGMAPLMRREAIAYLTVTIDNIEALSTQKEPSEMEMENCIKSLGAVISELNIGNNQLEDFTKPEEKNSLQKVVDFMDKIEGLAGGKNEEGGLLKGLIKLLEKKKKMLTERI